ncbi:MAG: hypothetical protein R3348_00780 [Xanthomonadales bacterium]|nr:hypothetical protein [Xanthomonadales bacterium]
MNRTIKRLGIMMLAAVPELAAADMPVSLDIEAPKSKIDMPLLSESGWPLHFELKVRAQDMLGFAKFYNYPNLDKFGFIVFDDPDGCPWMDDDEWRQGNGGLPPLGCEPFVNELFEVEAEEDETYLEFRPGIDQVGVEELLPLHYGNQAEHDQLQDPNGSDGPEFQRDDAGVCEPGTDDSDCFQFGPLTGGATADGWGIASDDDLPGLFVYMEAGVGLVYDEPLFVLSDPVGVRNLAGMLNTVSYELSGLRESNFKEMGTKGKPGTIIESEVTVHGQMVVPSQLVRNIIQYDACVGNLVYGEPPFDDEVVGCDGDDEWSVDGGVPETAPMNFGRGDAASIFLLEDTVFTISAFVVSGHAPDVLFDVDGDGSYADDAADAGYTVLSEVKSVDLIQVSNILCWGGGGGVMAKDLDGNGESVVPIVCPTAPGGIDEPPR